MGIARSLPLLGLSCVNGETVKTLRFRPRFGSSTVRRSMGVSSLTALTSGVCGSQSTTIVSPRSDLAVGGLVCLKASTNNVHPGTIITCGLRARRFHSNRRSLPRGFGRCVVGFGRTSSSPAARVRVMCDRVTGTTKVGVISYFLGRVSKEGRFMAREFSHGSKSGVLDRPLTTVVPNTSSCVGLY